MPLTGDLLTALPEIWLLLAAMALLMLGVFRGQDSLPMVAWLSVLALLVGVVLVLVAGQEPGRAFGGLFVLDGFAVYMKALVLIASAAAIALALGYLKREQIDRFEYPVLVLFATAGMLMMISANDLMALYLGLELQSLALYVLAAIQRDSVRSTEAGLKYFVLGALSSGMLLFGASIVYGFSGTTGFDGIATLLGGTEPQLGLIVGLVLVSAGLAFKVSAVPFHMWTPDVYEGAPTPVTALFAIAPKIAAMALFIRVMIGPFGDIAAQWTQIIIFVAIASMALGAFAAIAQTNIKRLMAYSSIGHIGYAMVGLAAGTPEGVRGVLIYMAIYVAMNIGTFACILCMRVNGRAVEGIDDLAGLSRTNPMMAVVLAIFMFSMAGIPPLAGFFGKLYVFMAAIEAGLVLVAVVGVITSVIAAYYYIRIVKLMFFDEPSEAFDRPIGRDMTAVIGATGLFTTFFIVFPAPIVESAARAASSLFGG
jgi:NADH-quinone oxidoreductase subunit N